jgi:hypothetical protein
VVENVAGGDLGYLDPHAAVYEIWADPVHGRTMTGFATGSMGAGIADDGTTAYYTLEVRPGLPGSDPGASGTGTPPLLLTPVPFATLVPATPLPDGTIVHIVGYGQTLWSIALAYGILIDQIRAWNNIPAGSNDIYVGQRLLVRPASLVTRSPTLSPGAVAAQKESVLVSTLNPTGEGALTAFPPGSPSPVPRRAVRNLTGAETQAGVQVSIKDTPAEPGLLVPILAGSSILFGCTLLFMLRRDKGS